ncbi:site-specific integrase [Paenibacillus selenitireducens]|uniref:Site-specific integrase n=1 Tax=Paenibacillus selenitireducens TaxID=1324314 RepID=A0A1T2XCE4_9BACL|nr:site-specific integrase [Paenibacillus selenitireducens]OPA77442.1 site-specific integrase [Paenibacillus selenitireducens]
MASYQKRGKNSYLLVVEAGYNPDGSRIKKTKTIRIDDSLLKTQKKINNYLDEELIKFKIEVETGNYISLEKMSFKAFVEEWRTKFVEKDLEATTIENYNFQVKRHILPYFGHMSLDKIKTMHIVNYMQKLSEEGSRLDGGTLGQASLVYNYRVLKSIFTKAVNWKVIPKNPMEGVSKPKETTKEMEVYSEEEVELLLKLLEKENAKFRILIILALTTGMRRGELLGLEEKHIDLDNEIIHIKQSIPKFVNREAVIKSPKTKGSVRKVVIPSSIIDELRTYISELKKQRLKSEEPWLGGDHFFLFSQPNGKPIYPKTLGEMWRSFHKRNPKLKYIRFHDLRHTAATLLINKGVHAKIISNRLGHSKITTTMNVYGHVIESADRSAAEKLNAIFQDNSKSSRTEAN